MLFFAELPTSVFGEKLREQVEERLKFYETGDVPRKNTEVMKEALEESFNASMTLNDKKKKKKKKRKAEEMEGTEDQVDTAAPEPKKKKGKHQVDPNDDSFHQNNGNGETLADEPIKKKKKKNK